jgi:hypothetical protein
MNVREAAKAGDTNFTNAFALRPRFAATLADRPTNPQRRTKETHEKTRAVRGTGVSAKALTSVEKKAAQSKLSGFAGW